MVRPWRRQAAGPRAAAGTAGSCRARQTRRSGGTVSPAPSDSRGQARASEQNRSQRTVTSEACAAEYASHCALSTPLRAAGTTTKSGSCWRPMRAAAGTAMPLCSRSSERALSACTQAPDSEHTPTTSPVLRYLVGSQAAQHKASAMEQRGRRHRLRGTRFCRHRAHHGRLQPRRGPCGLDRPERHRRRADCGGSGRCSLLHSARCYVFRVSASTSGGGVR
jgi:hypothetical protein